jgi:hypothetical protein
MCNGNFWQAISAIATTFAVLVALFGQAFRAKFFPPKLSLRLLSAAGELTNVTLSWIEKNALMKRDIPGRYYHVCVSNSRRWSPSQQVQIMLLVVEEPAADGRLLPVWTGELPLGWRHKDVYPVMRTIGSEACVDICSVTKDDVTAQTLLHLHPLIAPNNLRVARSGASTFVLTIQARGSEGDSPPFRLQISWDGQWDAGSQEMQRHLSIRPLD